MNIGIIFIGTEVAVRERFLQMLRNWSPEIDTLCKTVTTTQELEPDLWTPPHFPELICPFLCFQRDTWGIRDPPLPWGWPEPSVLFEPIEVGLLISGLKYTISPSFLTSFSQVSCICGGALFSLRALFHFQINKEKWASKSHRLSALCMKRFILCHISVEILRNVKRLEQNENRLKMMSETKMQ